MSQKEGAMLTCERLTKFDLFEACEAEMGKNKMVEFLMILQDIAVIDQFIKELPSAPGSTEKIKRNELVSVVGATLSIEGKTLAESEIEDSFQKADKKELLDRREQEAENSRLVYQFIARFVFDNCNNIVYEERLIKQIHKEFTNNMNYLSNVPGEYRNNFETTFGEPRKASLCRTLSEIQEAMWGLVNWLNSKETGGTLSKEPLIKAIMAHYYLTEIHPFGDGNGRTARALEALILLANNVNVYCFWSLANFWSSNKELYLTHLHNIRQTFDPCEFIMWGLQGYREEIKRVKNRVLKKVKQVMFDDYLHYLLRTKRTQPIKITERIIDVIQLLERKAPIPLTKFFGSPELTAIYRKEKPATRTRDFKIMTGHKLITMRGDDDILEVNYALLDTVVYNV